LVKNKHFCLLTSYFGSHCQWYATDFDFEGR